MAVFHLPDLLAALDINDTDRPIETGGGETFAVGHPGHEGRSIEVGGIRARHFRRTDRLHELLAVVGELVYGVHVIVDQPHMLFRIVGADVGRMRALEDLVPLRPLFDDVARAVDDDDAILPAGVDAELPVGR